MAVMKSKDESNLIVDCCCGCDEGLRIRVDKDDSENYMIVSYTSGNFYKLQNLTMFKALALKLKKIWRIIRSKDFIYSEICMTKTDFEEFKEYINSID